MFFPHDHLDLYYEVHGEGRPLILLHGNGDTHAIFSPAIPLLARQFTVYLLDTRGHGQSSPVDELHYDDMAEDVVAFIREKKLKKPVLYGFSDGGIVALLIAGRYPDLLSAVIASGANTRPEGLTEDFLTWAREEYAANGSPLVRLMLEEPHIPDAFLASIRIPVHLIAGEHDIVREEHSRSIAAAIPGCRLHILPGEDHGSYVMGTEKIGQLILQLA